MLRRAFLAIVFIGMTGAVGYYIYHGLIPEPLCRFCRRPIHPATYYKITLRNGQSEKTCCPRCGIRFQIGRNDIESVEAADFNSGKRINAEKAYYLEGSDANFCCGNQSVKEDRMGMQYELQWDRCLPSLIAFEDKAAAEAFSRIHGGRIRTYGEVLEESRRDVTVNPD